jgi:hypothetical protein
LSSYHPSRLLFLACVLGPTVAFAAASASLTPRSPAAPVPSNAPQFGAIQLFNGRDLSGLQVYSVEGSTDPSKSWVVSDGVLHASGTPYGYIRTQMAYADYRMHVEWRWPKAGGNSGVVMHVVNRDELWPKGFEVNMLAGQAGSFAQFWDARSKEESVGRIANRFSTGRLARRGPETVEKPLGEWNSLDIVAAGDNISVAVNGVEVNRMSGVAPSGGMIALQSEGTAIEFRHWTLTPLPPAKDLVSPVPATR